MIVCQANFADFVVWTMKGIFIERIKPDNAFFSNTVDKIGTFYIHVILPEGIGKWFTRQYVITGKSAESIEELGMSIEPIATATWCYCGLDESVDDMIQCDNASCDIIWFHLACLEIEKIPKGKWYCPECRPLFK